MAQGGAALPIPGGPVAQGSGLVRFRGEDFVRSYYGEAEGDDPHFEDGWFYPGDIATLSPDRMLTILGRNDNVVNLGGVKTTLETVEAGLSSAPGVKEIAVVSPAGGAERRQVIAFVAMGDGWSEAAFWDYCNTRVSKAMRPAKLVVMADLPKLSSGKIDRQRLTVLVPAS